MRLLGVFGSALAVDRGDADEPHDIDVAVSFAGRTETISLLDELTALTDCDRIDLVVLDGASPVLRRAP